MYALTASKHEGSATKSFTSDNKMCEAWLNIIEWESANTVRLKGIASVGNEKSQVLEVAVLSCASITGKTKRKIKRAQKCGNRNINCYILSN